MKISTLVSVAVATTVQLAYAAPFSAPGPEGDFGSIEVRGVGHLHDNFLKKRAIDAQNQMTDTNNGFVGGIEAGNVGKQMVNRREIRDLAAYTVPGDSQPGRVYDLYILALRRTMTRSPADKNSWWQLAGIHGRPFVPWNDRKPGTKGSDLRSDSVSSTNTGYCTHGSTLFPTWHRPYLAYVEELLWASAHLEVRSETRATEKVQWEKALEQFRIPYWDWGLDNADLPPQVYARTHEFKYFPNRVKADFPQWENPLYTFKFNPNTYQAGSNFGNDRFKNWFRTLRHPPNEQPGVGDNISECRDNLRQNGNSVRQQVHELLLRSLPQDKDANINEPSKINTGSDPARWGAFSNRVGNNAASVESIHDGIHVWVGGLYGHMTSVPYSSFDPVFFLHHTNVDRLFAIWQAINPKSYVTPQQNGGGTYGVPWNQNDDSNSPLEPWLTRAGWRFNSNTVRDTATFGYGYEEVPKHTYANSPTGLRRFAMKAVTDLYGNRVASSSKRKRDLYSSEENQGLDNSIVNNKYYEWRVDVAADRAALNGSYSVHFFLGKPDRDYKKWTSQPEFVGDYVVFTHNMEAPPGTDPATINTEITGSVPLTDAMVLSFGQNLTSLNPPDAKPFLIKNLRWRVSDSTGRPVRARNVKGLKVSVSISHTTLPTDETPWTQYGEWTFLTDIARRIGKDGGPDKIGIPDLSSTSTTVAPTTTEAPAYNTDLPTLVTLTTSSAEESTTEAVATAAPTSVAEDVEIPTPTSADATESTVEAESTVSADDSSPTDD
ncbi:hypothetical protein TWF569_009000 [Orbilia oligospora]|uniref:tyrosinase n=1 Tax=Orbilia oligospora TaxID=2813651 RepID=A0A7C8P2D4_ORBOL|nr:hypothetical protein TWF706_006921 [Orbilia oligospora]KAF3124844.1 hypothetical protein TWF703_011203 [Orbilia oligospora]KAF3145437.1 hypothetical protein TWF594_004374 [Orbilia oligospora]KAF3155638.1 hypothetical protein TWF569_009000 [Orbilia oligospora]